MIPEFDSHQEIKGFTAVGMDEKHAEKIVHLVMRSNKIDVSKLATKDDLKQVEVGLRKDIEQVEVGLRKDIERMGTEVKVTMLKWVLPLIMTNTIALLGVVVKLFLTK